MPSAEADTAGVARSPPSTAVGSDQSGAHSARSGFTASRGLVQLRAGGYVPVVALALEEMELFDSTSDIQEDTLARWRRAYACMVQDAVGAGIPYAVIPALSDRSQYAEIRKARDHLSGMLASFMSANI